MIMYICIHTGFIEDNIYRKLSRQRMTDMMDLNMTQIQEIRR